MSIQIIKAGIFSTLQDKGRYGFQHLGINPSGAMDLVSARIANYLVGNCSNEAVIESHFPASQILFNEDALIALSGADFGAMINDQPIPINTPVLVSKLTALQFSKPIQGSKSYLAIRGGFTSENWLNSNSTDTRLQKGGCKKPFKKEDIISFKQQTDYSSILKNKDCLVFHCSVDVHQFYNHVNSIRFIESIEFSFLQETSKIQLIENSFQITAQSDRMGYRLNSIALEKKNTVDIISSAVTRGTIQLLPNGQLVILMADHQTTGGYPRIGNIITADLHKLAQLKVGESFTFIKTDLNNAHNLLIEMENALHQIQTACSFKIQEFLNELK